MYLLSVDLILLLGGSSVLIKLNISNQNTIEKQNKFCFQEDRRLT